MVKPIDEIARIIAQAERAAYQKGWNEALAHVVKVAGSPMPPEQQQSLPLQAANGTYADTFGKPTMVDMVAAAITANPGMKGSEIVSTVQLKLPGKPRKAIDRTARTALMRLKKRKRIVAIDGKWFPNLKEAAA